MLKTLLAAVDGRPVCVLVPSDREIAMKKLAAACDARSAAMLEPAAAERISGYKVGGISPFGQRRTLTAVIEAGALAHDYVYVNGGLRGLQIRLAPEDLRRTLSAVVAAVVA